MGFSLPLNRYLGVFTAVLLVAIGIVLFRKRRQITNSQNPNYSKRPTHAPQNSYQPQYPSMEPLNSKLHLSPSNSKPFTMRSSPERRCILDSYNVTVIESVDACETFLATRLPSAVKVVGLDCEWRSTSWLNRHRGSSVNEDQYVEDRETAEGNHFSEKGVDTSLGSDCFVALLQLAFSNGELALVRLCKMERVGERLRTLLADKSILKFGVGINNDVKRMAAGLAVQTLGCVDLQHIAVRCGIMSGTSLQGLAGLLLGVELDKSFHLRCGDWEAETLTQDQIEYAAMDAAVALHILQALVEVKLAKQDRRESVTGLTSSDNTILEPTCSAPILNHMPQTANHIPLLLSHDYVHSNLIGHSLEAWLLNEERSSGLISLCQGVLDTTFKQRRNSKALPILDDSTGSRRTSAYSVRRSRLYDNCRLLAPDGQLLSTMHKKKLEWYLDRGLGTLLSESPMTVQLHFEPAGRPGEDREYYLREKKNVCAVCGTDQNCVRKNIVPHEYRRHFPPQMKEHLSHDILLMCVSCHQLASRHSAILKQQISAEHGLECHDNSSQKYSENPDLKKVKNHARVLLKGTANIPEERVQVLKDTVASHYGIQCSELTPELISEASEIDPRSPNSGYMSHAELVVTGLLREGGMELLFEFQKRWRQYFLDTMSPKFLPPCWSVDHNPS